MTKVRVVVKEHYRVIEVAKLIVSRWVTQISCKSRCLCLAGTYYTLLIKNLLYSNPCSPIILYLSLDLVVSLPEYCLPSQPEFLVARG